MMGSVFAPLATVHTSGPPYIAIAVPIVIAVVVALWAAHRKQQR